MGHRQEPGRVRAFWRFYREYTDTTVHTATTAALAIFGLLIFVDPWFAAVAIAAYVLPPVLIYALWGHVWNDISPADDRDRQLESQDGAPHDRSANEGHGGWRQGQRQTGGDASADTVSVSDDDTDSDTDDADTNSDSDDGDTDSDSDDGDTDSDSDDGDTDSDSDDGDTDSDSDSDSDDSHTDSNRNGA